MYQTKWNPVENKIIFTLYFRLFSLIYGQNEKAEFKQSKNGKQEFGKYKTEFVET